MVFNKTFQFLSLFLFIPSLYYGVKAQRDNAVFFDKLGKSTTENNAYYYRVAQSANEYKSFYNSDDSPYFEGKIIEVSDIDESKNKYSGKCTWYHKRGGKMMVRMFNDEGHEHGISYYYNEHGQLIKEIEYSNGKIVNNIYTEYDDKGLKFSIFEENFNANINDWDLYESNESHSEIKDNYLTLSSKTDKGTSRYISIPLSAEEFILEASFDIKDLKSGKAGIIYGFKDWENYNFFIISSGNYFIGSVYEGVSNIKADGLISRSINPKGENLIKIFATAEKFIYSINGEIQNSSKRSPAYGNKMGFVISGKGIIKAKKLVYKSIGGESNGVVNTERDIKATGSGIIFTRDGYIVTNEHVVENYRIIFVDVYDGVNFKTYRAELVTKDSDNDIAIIKIIDTTFSKIDNLNYSFKEDGNIEVGEAVFTIGYPLALSGMGKEPKFTDGKISSKRGFNSAINSFQSTIPVQPGNSGGPVFNSKGQLIGLINATVHDTDNVSYAIKLNYIKTLIELLSEDKQPPLGSDLSSVSLEEKIRILSRYTVLIKVK